MKVIFLVIELKILSENFVSKWKGPHVYGRSIYTYYLYYTHDVMYFTKRWRSEGEE